MKYFAKSYMLCALALCLAACHSDDDDVPVAEVETVQLIISVPATSAGTRMGDPGTAVDEGADWDRLAVILAYSDGSKVNTTTITQEQFNALPDYNGNTNFKLLAIDAEPGTVYIYGVTYSSDAANNPADAIAGCKINADVQALTISNDYSKPNDGTIDYAKFVSVATGYYYKENDTTPAEFVIQEGGTGDVGKIPTMTLTRLASKIDIQWDAADAYDQGYTDVKVTDFTYKGMEYGRLFPEITITDVTNQDKSWDFYNTSEISQRNGRVYHYTFTDGATTPSVTFNISARKDGNDITGSGYTMNFSDVLQQAAWYKVNATIKGVTGSGSITLSMN